MVGSVSEEWEGLTVELGWPGGAAAAVGAELVAAYGEGCRRYHGIDHLAAVLTVLGELTAPRAPSTAARLAAWFHDAVYDPARFDNEERSAALAVDRLTALGTDAAVVEEVRDLVLATKRHDLATGATAGTDRDALLDADLAILGSPPAVYTAYAEAIRAEYCHLEDPVFRAGRATVLRSFLGRKALFATSAAVERFEAQARANLRAELEQLDGGRLLRSARRPVTLEGPTGRG